jgi:hypothetical protein
MVAVPPELAARGNPRGQRTVVVSVDFFVAVVSPIGETVVPLEVDPVLVTTPLTVVDFWLLVSVETTGGGMTGVVVCVVVVLDDVDCANAPPVMSARAIVAASKDLVMANSPGIGCERGSLVALGDLTK